MLCNVHGSCVIVATLYSIELALNAYSQWFSNFWSLKFIFVRSKQLFNSLFLWPLNCSNSLSGVFFSLGSGFRTSTLRKKFKKCLRNHFEMYLNLGWKSCSIKSYLISKIITIFLIYTMYDSDYEFINMSKIGKVFIK